MVQFELHRWPPVIGFYLKIYVRKYQVFMAQMNGMEKRNFTNSARNGGKTAEMRNNSAQSGMVGMSCMPAIDEAAVAHDDKRLDLKLISES